MAVVICEHRVEPHTCSLCRDLSIRVQLRGEISALREQLAAITAERDDLVTRLNDAANRRSTLMLEATALRSQLAAMREERDELRADHEQYVCDHRDVLLEMKQERDEARATILAIGAAMPGNTYAHGHTPLDAVVHLVGECDKLKRERDETSCMEACCVMDARRLEQMKAVEEERDQCLAALDASADERDNLRAVVEAVRRAIAPWADYATGCRANSMREHATALCYHAVKAALNSKAGEP